MITLSDSDTVFAGHLYDSSLVYLNLQIALLKVQNYFPSICLE